MALAAGEPAPEEDDSDVPPAVQQTVDLVDPPAPPPRELYLRGQQQRNRVVNFLQGPRGVHADHLWSVRRRLLRPCRQRPIEWCHCLAAAVPQQWPGKVPPRCAASATPGPVAAEWSPGLKPAGLQPPCAAWPRWPAVPWRRPGGWLHPGARQSAGNEEIRRQCQLNVLRYRHFAGSFCLWMVSARTTLFSPLKIQWPSGICQWCRVQHTTISCCLDRP
ncbi:uncharacterized protein LOC142558611 [Dermacentor variabilis]|uniref:uncharacterized protein LOC142558611 n=1 Tax=Dermacentor variabilis TaxID=34621 RepID=UPI003F5BE3D9